MKTSTPHTRTRCPFCHGTKIIKNKKCVDCNGTGLVKIKQFNYTVPSDFNEDIIKIFDDRIEAEIIGLHKLAEISGQIEITQK